MNLTYEVPNSQDLDKVTKVRVLSSTKFWHCWTNGVGLRSYGLWYGKHAKIFSICIGYRIICIQFHCIKKLI